jgi:uncharacterized membrane protein
MVILRLIHVFGGIFWVGVVWYNALFFLPRVKSFGQERGRIMQTMAAPPFPQYMTAASVSTVLSGILMYWNTSAGFSAAWILTVPGLVLTIAGLLGIVLVVEGFFVQRPAGLRMAELGRQAASAGGPPTPAMIEEMQALSARLERATYRGAYLLVLAVLGMATFRYL